jgi:threonine dehydrogenase-like Zn-dependent dehydrogenase
LLRWPSESWRESTARATFAAKACPIRRSSIRATPSIKVTACAICGSDLHIFDGVIPGMKWSKSARKQEAQGRRQGRGALHHFLRRPGGQAEYLRVPFAHVGPLEVPNGLSDEQVLFLSDIFPTGYMAADFCAASGRPIDALLANAGRGLGAPSSTTRRSRAR